MASNTKEVATELLPLLRVYTDGTIERLIGSPLVPPSLSDPATGVSSKDISISLDVSARVYLPKLTPDTNQQKLPIFVYFHGGGFCVESAFSTLHHRYINLLASRAKVLAVSVEFRLAPEYLLPTAYEDSWAALQWISSHSTEGNSDKDPWLIDYGDFDKVYIGGDTTGANIAHNLAMRGGNEPLHGGVKLQGAFLCQPFFWGSKPIRSESSSGRCRLWEFAYPSAPDGVDNPMINPFATGAPSLAGLGCSKLLVCVGEKDVAKERGIHYCDVVRECGWGGEVELYEMQGASHGSHILDPHSEIAKSLMSRLTNFFR
ncbi:2-hydroxyisoflavanone dehydratase-like [Actinidia eriantha]|uniref:2-hydroxyisoflavanone dehydratase-like n=1 Tax=Actinidia eriantha TaxID=165200 RepID=UPI00258BD119|nr:2-hydroxyisoflavanone dehydratase-like [Actinidia eriantha]